MCVLFSVVKSNFCWVCCLLSFLGQQIIRSSSHRNSEEVTCLIIAPSNLKDLHQGREIWKIHISHTCSGTCRFCHYCRLLPPVQSLWLVVSTILKNISQWEGWSHIWWTIKFMFATTNQSSQIFPTFSRFPVFLCSLWIHVPVNGCLAFARSASMLWLFCCRKFSKADMAAWRAVPHLTCI